MGVWDVGDVDAMGMIHTVDVDAWVHSLAWLWHGMHSIAEALVDA
jgi:hypothetical protein